MKETYMLIRSFMQPPLENINPIRPQSGIDKIKLLLTGNYVSPDFLQALKINNPYTLEPGNNEICLEKRGSYYLLILNQEFFDFNQNILQQINSAIILLINSKLLIPTQHSESGNGLPYIEHISEVEFYFDNRNQDLWVIRSHVSPSIDIAKQQNFFFQFVNNGNQTNTFYSSDYIPATNTRSAVPSRITIYDKEQRDLATIVRRKGITLEEQKQAILNHPWKTRLEFRFSRENFKYLNLQNFNGTYSQILNRYTECLAVFYNSYCKCFYDESRSNIFYTNGTNKALDKIIRYAKQNRNIERFTNNNGMLIE